MVEYDKLFTINTIDYRLYTKSFFLTFFLTLCLFCGIPFIFTKFYSTNKFKTVNNLLCSKYVNNLLYNIKNCKLL